MGVFPQNEGRKLSARSPMPSTVGEAVSETADTRVRHKDRNDLDTRVTIDRGDAVIHNTSGDLPGEPPPVSDDQIPVPESQTARPTILGASRAALIAFHRQGRGHDAAALTYYAMLAIVPSKRSAGGGGSPLLRPLTSGAMHDAA